MLLLDIQNERMLGMKKSQRAVALVPFGHEIFSPRIPVRVRSQDRNFRADVMRWMQAAFAQNVRHHGGGRGLAVHPGDDDAAFAAHDRGQRFSPAHRSVYPSHSAEARIGLSFLIADEKITRSASLASVGAMLWMKAQTRDAARRSVS